MKKLYYFCLDFFIGILISILFFSCVTARPPEKEVCSRKIADSAVKNSYQLAGFFISMNPEADLNEIQKMAEVYISEARAEGINSDVAFVQMCLETGFLRFGNLVTPDMHNYCGLGAIDAEHRGERFDTMEQGIRAHIQHLHAYGTTEDKKLKNELIDNRYKWVLPRGKAQDIYGLAGTWASDKQYGEKLEHLLSQLDEY